MNQELKEALTPGFICFMIALTSIILVLIFVVIPYFNQQDYIKAQFDLHEVNTCNEVLLFNSNLPQYAISIDDYNHIKNAIKQKLEILKCP